MCKRTKAHRELKLSPIPRRTGYDRGLLKSIGLFCKRALSKRLFTAKETYKQRTEA